MDFDARHRFTAPVDRVTSALIDPEFTALLIDITDVGAVEVIDQGEDSTTRWLSARLTYNGSLDPVAAKVLGSSTPTWVQTYRIDHDNSRGDLEIRPDHHGSLLHCHAEFSFGEVTGGCERRLKGDLSVRVPLLGGRAERALLPPILARIDAEAALLESWLNRQ